MMLFKAGIYSALVSLSHGYLMPGQTDKIVYADTRILDPRYARSAENLVCQSEVTHDVMKHLPTGGGGKGGKPAVQEHTEMRAIGCCPAGDPNGKLQFQKKRLIPFGYTRRQCRYSISQKTHFIALLHRS